MDANESLINSFADTLRNHRMQRTVSLYRENQSQSDSRIGNYEIKDVISGVAKQLKAIQNADSVKKRPSGKGIPSVVKKSTFLPVYMIPVEQVRLETNIFPHFVFHKTSAVTEAQLLIPSLLTCTKPPKQQLSHKFETQCVLDTQLMNIIEDAEAILDVGKGITQEFNTTFCQKDVNNSALTLLKNYNTIDSKPNIDQDSEKSNQQLHECNLSYDNKILKLVNNVENRMILDDDEKDRIIEDNSDCYKNRKYDNTQEENLDKDIQVENYSFKGKYNKENVFVNQQCLTKEETITKITVRDFTPKKNSDSNSKDFCDNFDTQSNFYFDTLEDDNNYSQTEELIETIGSKMKITKSPILNNIQPKLKSNTPSPLIFELEPFEKFEMIALPIIENHDFETAKRVINSQILNRELFIHTHAEAVLSDRDKDIQKKSPTIKYKIKTDTSHALCTDNKLNLKEDSMLFSSDEENDINMKKINKKMMKELPLTCALEKSFDDQPDILDKTMFVGFQTASNRSIQISSNSYCKAKFFFDNLASTERENLSGSNFVEALDNIATTNSMNKINHTSINDTIHNIDDDIDDLFKTAKGEIVNMSQKISNIFEYNNTVPRNDDKLKNNDKNISESTAKHLQSYDYDISGKDQIKFSENKNKKQETGNVNVPVSSIDKAKDNQLDKNCSERNTIDDHILEEFSTDLIPDVSSNKINELIKDNILDCKKVSKSMTDVIEKTELEINLEKPLKNFVGFRTANNKMIKISAQALMKTKNILENIDSNDDSFSRKTEKQRKIKSDINKISKETIRTNTNLDSPSNLFVRPYHDNKENEHLEENNVRSIINESEVYNCNLPTPILQSSKTTIHKPVPISKQELVATKKVFHDINVINEDAIEKPLQPVRNTELNAFQGFITASNKPVKISESALAKSKNIFQDIEMNEETNNVFKIPACGTVLQASNAMKGFTTASNKPIKISEKALAITKDIFQDAHIENNEENCNVFGIPIPEIKTPKSEKQLVMSDFQNIFDTKAPNFEFSNLKDETPALSGDSSKAKPPLLGFKTASNKSVKISKESLSKTKKIFQDIDILNHKEGKIISANFDNKSSTSTNDDPDNIFIGKQPYPVFDSSKNVICQGFKTASHKAVEISTQALAKSKKIFQYIDEDDKIINDFDNTFNEKKTTDQGFKTANNMPVSISAEALAKSKKIFQDIDEDDKIIKDVDNTFNEKKTTDQGFKTANNMPVGISAEALAKSKKIFQDIDDEGSNIVNNFDDKLKEKQPYYSVCSRAQNILCQGFKTAGNKPVEISEDALTISKNMIENMNKACEIKQVHKEVIAKQSENLPNKQHNFKGFNTASNNNVEVSDIDLDGKSENCFFKDPSNLDIYTMKGSIGKSVSNFGFKTGNNTQINISEEALRKSRNVLSDFDDSINVKTYPKLNPDHVISRTEILENFNTEIIKDFEDTLYTEDFIKEESPKSKRSGSPIVSCPKIKKRKKFETPVIRKKFIAPINRQSAINTDTDNVYKFNENYKNIKQYTLKDLSEKEKLSNIPTVDPYFSNFQFDTLLDFEFIGERNDIDNDIWTTYKIKRFFTDSVNKRIIPEGWIENHIKLIIWKLISYEIRFPEVMRNVCTVKNVLEQLNYRYKRELYNVERPALRKILERDEVSTKVMVLCVVGLFVEGVNVSKISSHTQNIELLLTDGWYSIKASSDRMINRLVCEGKISVGTKLVIHGAELLNCEQGVAPWEDTSAVRLKVFGNSTRRAKWDARLGFHGYSAILSRLSAVKPEGGKVSHLRTFVTRVYPTLYIEKFPDGSTLTRSERLENIYQMKYETERQIQMEKLYEELEKFSDQESQDSEGLYPEDAVMESGSQISRLMKRSRDREDFRANLTSSQADLLQRHALKQKEKLLQVMQDKFRELVQKRGLDAPRNVVPLMKIRVADVDPRGISRAMVTIWKPNETVQEMLTEGTWIDLYSVVPTSVRYSEIQISAGRQSVFRRSQLKETEKLKTLTKTLKRRCYTAKELQNPSMNTDYKEVDTVGIIFMVEPQTIEFETKNQPFQNVYLTDADKNIICINFWGGIKKFGFQNILDTGQVVMCVNLQKRAGNTRKYTPQYRATEFTYFTKTPKNDTARKMINDLVAKFSSLDKRKFIDDCVALKNNYQNYKCGNTENVSPYRLNTSDYNVYKNKVFIDSPLLNKCTDVNLNLTGLDFESTFKQTDTQDLSPQILLRKRKVNEKIAKLKMYGEPPPLSPIHIINKSTVQAFKCPLAKSYISTSVASPSALPQNGVEKKSSADGCHHNNAKSRDGNTNLEVLSQDREEHKPCVTSTNAIPQNRIDKIDSSPVFSLNRTYVKRPSITPVKLNFSNAMDASTVDPFAEDFDDSPPLSLDVNFVT